MMQFTLNGNLWTATQYVHSLETTVNIYIAKENLEAPTSKQFRVFTEFDSLPSVRKSFLPFAHAHFKRIAAIVDFEEDGIEINENKLEIHYNFSSILVPELLTCEDRYLFVSADCDWEPEHGIQALFCNERLFWCGDPTPLPFSAKWKEIINGSPQDRERLLAATLY